MAGLDYATVDGPRDFRDFTAASPGVATSDWFESHAEYDEGTGGAASAPYPLGDISNTVVAQAGGAAGEADAKPGKKKNIVTSWGNDATKKNRAEEGAAEKRTAKAAKRDANGAAAMRLAQPAPAPKERTKRSKAAAAEARRESTKQIRLTTGLKVVKGCFKTKAKLLSAKMQHHRVMSARSTKQLTLPDEIELHTSKRAAAHHAKDHHHHHNQVVGSLAHDDDHDGGSEADTDEGSPYKPLVLRVKEFDKTPGRFKKEPDAPLPAKPLVITEAKEPQLLTSARVRPSAFKPRELAEAEEMAQMPVFKASTLNPLILSGSGGLLGVPKVEKRGPTSQRPFNFVTDDRAEARAARLQKQQGQEAQHHAGERQTVSDTEGGRDKENASRSLAAKARKSVAPHLLEPVVPRSPMLRTKLRAREPKIEPQRHEFHARPLPKYLSLPSLELPRGHNHAEGPPAPTQPEPFRLATEDRGARHRAQQEARRAEEERAAARARIPRANGLPLSTDMPLVPPKPEPRKLTVPEPFELISEVRHCKYEEQKRRELEEEAARRAELEFKARPMWKGIPFRPVDVEVPLTVPVPVELHTSARVTAREEFNKHMEDKMKEMEELKKQREEEKLRREEEERQKLRKAAVFRALPMPDLSAPPVVQPLPHKPTTVPKSPALALTRRKRRRSGKKKEEEADC